MLCANMLTKLGLRCVWAGIVGCGCTARLLTNWAGCLIAMGVRLDMRAGWGDGWVGRGCLEGFGGVQLARDLPRECASYCKSFASPAAARPSAAHIPLPFHRHAHPPASTFHRNPGRPPVFRNSPFPPPAPRYALNLITAAALIAHKRKAAAVDVEDISRAYTLFIDIKRSVQVGVRAGWAFGCGRQCSACGWAPEGQAQPAGGFCMWDQRSVQVGVCFSSVCRWVGWVRQHAG